MKQFESLLKEFDIWPIHAIKNDKSDGQKHGNVYKSLPENTHTCTSYDYNHDQL